MEVSTKKLLDTTQQKKLFIIVLEGAIKMSWSIELLENNVKINAECAKEILKLQQQEIDPDLQLSDIYYEEHLLFNSDYAEHMDYLSSNKKYLKILCKHVAQGDICFGSLEGDNAGQFWGYRFDGKGDYKRLEGSIVWNEE